MLYWHRSGRKGTTTEKKTGERIYIKKILGLSPHRILSLFLAFFFSPFPSSSCHPQLLIYPYLSSALRSTHTACEGEKVVIFLGFFSFFFPSSSTYNGARARVYIHSHPIKISPRLVNFKEKKNRSLLIIL